THRQSSIPRTWYRGHSVPCTFFFQAADGIRSFHVTGVQTCALPISLFFLPADGAWSLDWKAHPDGIEVRNNGSMHARLAGFRVKIGRASCRERAETARGAGPLKHSEGMKCLYNAARPE